MLMNRKDILEQAAQAVCVDRNKQYGEPEDNFEVIARYWSTYLETQVNAEDVANMMMLFKIARNTTGKSKADNWIDIAGYAACGGEITTGKEVKK